jgi:hypothetical protein
LDAPEHSAENATYVDVDNCNLLTEGEARHGVSSVSADARQLTQFPYTPGKDSTRLVNNLSRETMQTESAIIVAKARPMGQDVKL